MESPISIAPFTLKPYTLAGLTMDRITSSGADYLCSLILIAKPSRSPKSIAAENRYTWTRTFLRHLQQIDFDITLRQRVLRRIHSEAQAAEVADTAGAPHTSSSSHKGSLAMPEKCIKELTVNLIPQREQLMRRYVDGMDALAWLETEFEPWAPRLKQAHRDYIAIPVVQAVNDVRRYLDDPQRGELWPERVENLDELYVMLMDRATKEWPERLMGVNLRPLELQ